MRDRWLAAISVAAVTAIVVTASVLVIGQGSSTNEAGGASNWTAPRTPWGHPDLQGIWTNEETGTPLERPAKFGTRELLTDAEVTELEQQALARYEKARAEADPAGPRSRADIERTKGTVEAGIYGAEYNNVWMEQPTKPGKLRWRRTSLVVDPPEGRIPPYTPELIKRLEAREEARKHRGEADSWEDRNLNERCMTPQAATGLGGTFRIVQTPGWVAILPDGLQATRLIPLDGRPQVSSKIRGWFGRSRGRWDQDKLVVETTNFIGKLDGGPVLASRRPFQVGYVGSGETLRRIETYRRVGPDQIEYGMTTDDPSVFVRPYTVLRPLILKNDFMMLQSGCHEGNYGMPNILAAGRADEAYAKRAADEAAAGRRAELEAMKRKTEAWLKTGKISTDAPTTTGREPVPDR
jgi:hypothetical protein